MQPEAPPRPRPAASGRRAGRRPAGSGVSKGSRGSQLLVMALFGASALAGIATAAAYLAGGDSQVFGPLLAASLAAMGAGITIWVHRVLVAEVIVEERHPFGSEAEIAAVGDALAEERSLSRRSLLVWSLGGAFAGLGAALAVPFLSLGPAPTLFVTPWRKGMRLVGLDGQPIKAASIPIGGIQTVFPEGSTGTSDGQTILIRVEPGLLQLPAGRLTGAPGGYVAYSKLCTHAGCSVGLYRASEHKLVCPCHQSTFDVLAGATPTSGPAARRLPQLPIQLQPDGTFIALDGFPEPIGPSFWDIHSGGRG